MDIVWTKLSRFYPKMRSNRHQIFFSSFFKISSGLTNTAVVMFLWQSFINNYYREKSCLEADIYIKIYINMGGIHIHATKNAYTFDVVRTR